MFKQIDIFGSQILLNFKGEPTYRTKTGSIVTLLIIGFICFRLFAIIKDVFLRSNPQVIYNERQVDDPAPFVISSETFPLAFGMQDSNFNHYIDESIYTIQAKVYQRTQIVNEVTQQHEFVQKNIDIQLQPCTLENFKNPDNLKYYTALNYQNMYCLPPDLEITIEGDFFSPQYSELQLNIIKCQKNCKSDTILDQYLLNTNFAMQITDSYVDPSSKNEPFNIYSRNLFWPTSTQMPKLVSLYYRNNYVQSDFGWFFPDLITQRNPAFSFNDVTVYPDKFQSYFLSLIIRCEKQKEGAYSRTYKNFNNIMSEIGGFTQSLLAIGYLICTRISQLQLNQTLINQAFNYVESSQEKKKTKKEIIQQKDQIFNSQQSPTVPQRQQPDMQDQWDHLNRAIKKSQDFQNQNLKVDSENHLNPLQSQKGNNQSYSPNQSQNQDQKILAFENNKQNKENENQDRYEAAKVNDLKQSNPVSKSSTDDSDQKKILNMLIFDNQDADAVSQAEKDQKILDQETHIKLQKQKLKIKQMEKKLKEDKFKQLMDKETKCMKMSIWEYFKSKIYPFGDLKDKKQIIEYSIDKLYYNLDIFNILKKLIEVEKLKRLVLDPEQLKLFDYLPKPTIHSDLVLNKIQGQEQIKNNQEVDVLYQDNRTDLQKVRDAFHAYKKIANKQKQTILDQKIIDLLDPNLVSIFQAQGSFGFNNQIEKSNIEGMVSQSKNIIFSQQSPRIQLGQIHSQNIQAEAAQEMSISKQDETAEKQEIISPRLINDSQPFFQNQQSQDYQQGDFKYGAKLRQDSNQKIILNSQLVEQVKDLSQSLYSEIAAEQSQQIPKYFSSNFKSSVEENQ